MNQDIRNRVAETIIVVAVLGAAWFVLVQPFRERAAEAGRRVRSLEAELANYKANNELTPEQSQRYLARVGRLTRLAAPRGALSDHEAILALAKRDGLDIERINPAPDAAPSRLGPIVVGSRRFQVQTDGSFASFVSFLSGLSTGMPMTVVDHFSIAVADPSNPDDLTLTADVKTGRLTAERTNVAEVEP